jgi:hypothetical protein
MRHIAVVLFLGFAALPGWSQTAFPNTCPAGGSFAIPAAIQMKHPVDSACSVEGKLSSPDPSHTQNKVKNNFCAPMNAPQRFTPQMLIDLQTQNNIPSGEGLEPADRSALKALGEGKVIRMKAYLIEAHHADLGSGESVNCSKGKEEDNDIHIAFGASANATECSSVTAEISPHYRPASWNEIGHYEKYNPATHKYTVDPAMATRLRARPYRITGQLFFDASHTPCPCNTNCSPARSSVWEIHPIYRIEVCKAGTQCKDTQDADWIDFDPWWKSLEPLQPIAPPHEHPSHEKKQ